MLLTGFRTWYLARLEVWFFASVGKQCFWLLEDGIWQVAFD
jgi:hypothetical protein